ncbi:MAG: hypothetical protein RBT71_12255 [Flavobacteriales bacterium]|nr:hypothetical protein [Flavobacteriales bacterium]
MEFSPNGRYIYFVKSPDHAYPNSGGPQSNFGYIDLAWQMGDPGTYHAFLPIDVPAETRKLVDTQMGINVGPNGTGNALYVIGAEADGYWLGAFLDPDNPDPANWQPGVVDLSTVAYRTEANSPLTKFKLVNRRAVSSTHAALLATQACCEDLVLARDRSAVITAEDCDLTWEPGDNAFWNTSAPVHVATELRIATGAHVIANNMEFLFGQDAELVIEAGASLVCTDCLFTTACEGTRWKGIRVEGTSTDPLQAAAHQGVLRITTSTVENAETGVWCARVNEQGYAVPGHFGGYLRAYHCTFRNCITGVHIERYQRTSPAGAVMPHRSNFFNCTFETTAQWPAGAHPYAHAHLFDVQGIKLQQCRFINHVPAQFPALNRGWGVLALMAGFDVEGSSTPDASLFQDLSIGVVAATGTLRKANVRRSWFRDNIVGAYMMACTAPEVSRSHFFVPGSSAPTLTPAGLTLHQSNTYLVEENNFHGAQMVNGSVGIHFIGDVRAEDRIYNNTFNGLNAGTYVVGRHKGNTPETEMQGLQLFCGDYTDCILDYALGNNTYIKKAQGFYGGAVHPLTQLAANRFYPGLVNGITISTVQPTGPTAPHFNYLRHSVPECDPLNPSDYYSDIEINAMDEFIKAEACGKGLLPHTGGGGGTGTPAYVLAAAQLNSAQAYFTGTVDTGEREDIIEAIGQDDPWLPSHTLRDYLLARCPLSDAVLLRVIARTEPMDPWHLTQVLLGNARLTPQVLRAVEHSGLLNEYMLAIVQNAGNGPTVKDLLRQEVELRAMEKARAKVLAFDAIAADSLLAAPHDSLYAMLAAHPDHTDLYLLASMAQERDQYTLATAWLDSLQAVRDDGHEMLRDLYSMDQALDGDWPQADAGQRAQLATMASAYDPGAAMAWAIRYHLGETYEVPFADLPDGSKRLTWAPDKAPRPTARPLLEAHPNPTTGQSWVVINMELDDAAWLRISDPQGREVRRYRLASGQRLQELDLNGLANGLYTCELLQGEYKLDVVKLTVQR